MVGLKDGPVSLIADAQRLKPPFHVIAKMEAALLERHEGRIRVGGAGLEVGATADSRHA